MAAKQTNPVIRITATLFTSLVAPTLVALFTTAIREAPKQDSVQTVSSYRGSTGPTIAPVPTVTLLPPESVEPAPAQFVWKPVAVPAARTVTRP
jgi:hypothetical protein